MSVKRCIVRILRDGRLDWPYENAVVAGRVSGMGLHTEDFRTDDRGIATIEWYVGDYLDKIYVSGESFDVHFEDGGRYTIPY